MSLSQIGKVAFFKQNASDNTNNGATIEGLQKLLGLINVVNTSPIEYLVIPVP